MYRKLPHNLHFNLSPYNVSNSRLLFTAYVNTSEQQILSNPDGGNKQERLLLIFNI